MAMRGLNAGCEQTYDQCQFEKGESALCGGKYFEAADYFNRALKTDPFSARAHRGLGETFWAQGKIEDALNSLTRALELEPGDRDTVLACTRIFKAFGKEDFSKEVLKSYLDKHPDDDEIRSQIESPASPEHDGHLDDAAEFLLRQGESQFERGKIAHAVACFEMAIEQNPLMAEAYNNIGVINLEGGKTMEALENFLKALDLKPGDPEILANSARALVMSGQSAAAIDVQREYLRRRPEDNAAWTEYESLIRQSAGSGWHPGSLSKKVADIYIQTAEKLEEAGDLAGAAEAVEKALKIQPAEPGYLCVLASLHCAIGQKDEAAGILDQALTIDPSHARCTDMLRSIRNGNGAGVL